MTRTEADTYPEEVGPNERFLARSAGREQRRSCLVCGARISSGDQTVQIHGALIHMRCAVHRRRLVHR